MSTVSKGHEHSPYLAHHFDTLDQQFNAAKLGMWLFLATELLLFGGLFCGYAIWRSNHPEMFKYGSGFLNTTMGAINTAVLIASSLTMASAVTTCQRGLKGPTVALLGLTLAGAVTFLVIKYFEYSHKFHEGWYPGMALYNVPDEHAHSYWGIGEPAHPTAAGVNEPLSAGAMRTTFELPPAEASTVLPPAMGVSGLDPDNLAARSGHDSVEGDALAPEEAGEQHGPAHPLKDPDRPRNTHMFFNIYFMMTGLHGIHVLVGVIVLSWLMIGTIRGRFNAEYFTPIDLGGLYWHVVDLIWIFLFPLFYLI